MPKTQSAKIRPSYNFKPATYKLELKASPKDGTFSGTLSIEGQKLPPPSKRITLQQTGLKITDATIVYKHKKNLVEFGVTRINHIKSFHEVRLHTNNLLYPGFYTIKLSYKGKLTDDFTQRLKNPTESWRNIMPCVDELEAKENATVDFLATRNVVCQVQPE